MDYKKEAKEILKDMLDGVDDSYQKTIGFPTFDILAACAMELESLYSRINTIAVQLDVNNLYGEELTRFVFQRKGIIRKKATYAMTELLIVGGGTVPKGATFATEGDIEFEAMADSFKGKVQVAAKIPGLSGNMPAGSIRKIVASIEGVTAVTNKEPATGGFDEETDDELRERYYIELQKPATSGNVFHYMKWALEVPGVSKAKIYPLWDGPNTVKVIIIDGEHKPADEDLINKVQKYIDPDKTGKGEGQAPIGAICTVEAAKAVELNVKLHLDGEYDESVKKEIEKSIKQYLFSIAFVQDYVSYAKISNAVNDAPGVIDYSQLTVNDGVANIQIEDGSVAVLGGISFV